MCAGGTSTDTASACNTHTKCDVACGPHRSRASLSSLTGLFYAYFSGRSSTSIAGMELSRERTITFYEASDHQILFSACSTAERIVCRLPPLVRRDVVYIPIFSPKLDGRLHQSLENSSDDSRGHERRFPALHHGANSLIHQEIGVVLAIWGMSCSVGSSIGSAIAGCIWNNRSLPTLRRNLPDESRDRSSAIFGDMVVQISYSVARHYR
jgi:hypothetical protein